MLVRTFSGIYSLFHLSLQITVIKVLFNLNFKLKFLKLSFNPAI